MKPSDKYKFKKKVSAVIAVLLAVIMVLSLVAPFAAIY